VAGAIASGFRGTGLYQDVLPLLDGIAIDAWPRIHRLLTTQGDATDAALRAVGKHHHFSKTFAVAIGEALAENGYVIIRREA
jgi:hypothetical protein